jgi:hypothetical protein
MKRQLLQFGYNQALEGHAPLAGYAFYYLNQPNFMRPDLTLRLAVAPTYADSEFGFNHALGPQTDLAVGIAGGGFADSYSEIRRGRFLERESFTGHDGKASISLYHRFNPDQRVPLNGIVRGMVDYIAYEEDDKTADTFVLPPDHAMFHLLTGLRWGGASPSSGRPWRWRCPSGMRASSAAHTAPMVLTATVFWRPTHTASGDGPCWPIPCRT